MPTDEWTAEEYDTVNRIADEIRAYINWGDGWYDVALAIRRELRAAEERGRAKASSSDEGSR